jgi:hypothetical protein
MRERVHAKRSARGRIPTFAFYAGGHRGDAAGGSTEPAARQAGDTYDSFLAPRVTSRARVRVRGFPARPEKCHKCHQLQASRHRSRVPLICGRLLKGEP